MQTIIIFVFILASLFSSPGYFHAPDSLDSSAIRPSELPRLSDFSSEVQNGNPHQLVGIYIPDLFAFPVIQQPTNNLKFVSSDEGVVTQFDMASNYQTIGLLAHNTLAGRYFNHIYANQIIILIYGDGSFQYYHLSHSIRYQSLAPNDPYSKMKNLDNSIIYTAEEVFFATYGLGRNALILQTCIASGEDDSWGRLFLIALPVKNPNTFLVETINLSIKNLNQAFLPEDLT